MGNTIVRSPGLAVMQIELLLDYAVKSGISASSCLKNTELTISEFKRPHLDISPEQELLIIENIINKTNNCPFSIGYDIGFRSSLKSMGIIGHAISSSTTLLKAIGVASRYFPVAFHFIDYSMEVDEFCYKVNFGLSKHLPPSIQAFLLARDIGIITSVHKDALGHCKNSMKTLSFHLPAMQGMDILIKNMNCQFLFNQDTSFFIADIKNLSAKMPYGNESISKILEEHCQQLLLKAAQSKTTKSAVIEILEQEQGLTFSKDKVASQLNMCGRTLSRKLAQENTSWAKVNSELKLIKVLHLIETTSLSMTKITEIAGFSSPNSLSRYVAKSVGKTPKELRQLNINLKES